MKPATLEAAVREMLSEIDSTPGRPGLSDTPRRVAAACAEWYRGVVIDPASFLVTFEDGAEGVDELVLVSNVPVYSKCEHHLADIWGLAHVAYIPNGKVLGLSKFARIVDAYARRLQVQERLTNQVADLLFTSTLAPKGVGVVLECRHMCMESRGVHARGTITTTSALRGTVKSDPSARAEFLALVHASSKAKEGL